VYIIYLNFEIKTIFTYNYRNISNAITEGARFRVQFLDLWEIEGAFIISNKNHKLITKLKNNIHITDFNQLDYFSA